MNTTTIRTSLAVLFLQLSLIFGIAGGGLTSASAQDEKEKANAAANAETAEPKADPEIKALLDRLGLKYEIDEDADFRLVNGLDDDRSHVMFIESEKSEFRDVQVRRVWAVGYKAPESTNRIPSPVLRFLMEQSGSVKVGSWGLRQFGDLEVAVFTVRVMGELSDDEWSTVLIAVSETADEAELELTGKDDL